MPFFRPVPIYLNPPNVPGCASVGIVWPVPDVRVICRCGAVARRGGNELSLGRKDHEPRDITFLPTESATPIKVAFDGSRKSSSLFQRALDLPIAVERLRLYPQHEVRRL